MNVRHLVVAVMLAVLVSGCVTTHFEKQTTVTKDADGRIVQTVEVERAVQVRGGWPIKFDHLKGIDKHAE
jgi:outer membrane lipoprotein SlyB